MDEPRAVIQSEVSQKERNKGHGVTRTQGVLKSGAEEPICRAGIETQTQRRNLRRQRGKGWNELGEYHCRIYTAVCEMDSEWGATQHEVVLTIEGGKGRWEGSSRETAYMWTFG